MPAMTIQAIIDLLIGQTVGTPLDSSVDTVKIGDPQRQVTGVVCAFTVTHEVIRKANEAGANFIITHEPTFYNHEDRTEKWSGDPAYEAKRKALEESGITVWRFHDYMHDAKPDWILQGVLKKLGWEGYDTAGEVVTLPAASAAELAAELKGKLGIPQARMIGDAAILCRKVVMLLGAAGGEEQIRYLAMEDVDALVCGETVEWMVGEYVRDMAAAGRSKALVILGHLGSEEAGMAELAARLKEWLPDIPVTFLPVDDVVQYV